MYMSNCPEYANLVPKRTDANSGPKAKKSHQMLNAKTEKYLYKMFWNRAIFS